MGGWGKKQTIHPLCMLELDEYGWNPLVMFGSGVQDRSATGYELIKFGDLLLV